MMLTHFRPLVLALICGLLLLFETLFLLFHMGRPTAVTADTPEALSFVDDVGTALPDGEKVRILCFAESSGIEVLADVILETDSGGQPKTGLPLNCNYLAALHLQHGQPAGKGGHGPAYWVYYTSWSPGTTTPVQASGVVTLSQRNPLVLFNVAASLAWQPAEKSAYVAELRTGLAKASAYLYDLTEGQMAFGPVKIDTDGQNWNSADFRFLAANNYRPSAYVGGIVPKNRPYVTQNKVDLLFAPGAVFLGRYWDGEHAWNPSLGVWSAPNAYRTLVHEWNHYALFLYDEYQQSSGLEIYCVCNTLPSGCPNYTPDLLPSAMSYHYTASELWLKPPKSGTACTLTDQWNVHGETDWETLLNWEEIQGLSDNWLRMPTDHTAGPDLGLTRHLFDRRPGYQIYLPMVIGGGGSTPAEPPAAEPLVHVNIDSSLIGLPVADPVLTILQPQVYLIQEATQTTPRRIIPQGTTIDHAKSLGNLGSTQLLGVRPGSEARIFADVPPSDNRSGGRFIYPPLNEPGTITPGQVVELKPDPWRANLDIDYGLTGSLLTSMTLTLRSVDPLSDPPIAQFCLPDKAIGCPDRADWRKPMTPVNAHRWETTFSAPAGQELPLYGILHVQAPKVGELMTWYQDAGGVGPAHGDAKTPLVDGQITVRAETLPTSRRGQNQSHRVIIRPASNYDLLADGRTLPTGIQGIIAPPLDVDIILPEGDTPNLVVTFFYNQELLDRLQIKADQLTPLSFDRANNLWSVEQGVRPRVDTNLKWLTINTNQRKRIFALAWKNP